MSTTTTYTGVRIADMPDLGAFTSGSSIVGERAGSGRFSAASLGGYFLPISGLGYEIGDVPGPLISSGAANLPTLSTTNRLIFRRATPAATDSTDFQFDRQIAVVNPTAGTINRVIGVNSTLGVADASTLFGVLANMTSNTNAGGTVVGLEGNSTRAAGATGGYTIGGIFGAYDKTGLSSNVTNGPLDAMELDLVATGADDQPNTVKFGNVGVRQFSHYAFWRNSTSDPATEFSTGIWIVGSMPLSGPGGGGTPDPLVYLLQAIGFGQSTYVWSVLDTRGALPPSVSSYPLNAVTMSAGHCIDFNGGATLKSAPGNYLQYRTATGRLYYVVGGVDKWSVDASGNIRAAGTVTGSTTP